jgi:hypothetical protein
VELRPSVKAFTPTLNGHMDICAGDNARPTAAKTIVYVGKRRKTLRLSVATAEEAEIQRYLSHQLGSKLVDFGGGIEADEGRGGGYKR